MSRFPLVASLLMVVFSSCTTIQTMCYERLCPADVVFVEQIRKVGVVNNTPAVQQDYEQVDYASASLEGDGAVTVEALAQEVASAEYFDEVVVYDKQFRRSSYPLDQPIPKATVDELLHLLDVDMLLSMERVNVVLKDTSMIIPEVFVKVPAVEGAVTSVVRAYLQQRKEPLFTIQTTDTLCWEVTSDLTYGDVIKDVSEYAAKQPMKKLLPYWMEVQRNYFDGGGTEMRDAGVYVREQNWEEAALLWKQVLEKKKGKPRMRAAYNLALYSEMCDDFESALDYLDMAASCVENESFEGQLIEIYRMQLNALSDKKQILKLQMKRFD